MKTLEFAAEQVKGQTHTHTELHSYVHSYLLEKKYNKVYGMIILILSPVVNLILLSLSLFKAAISLYVPSQVALSLPSG